MGMAVVLRLDSNHTINVENSSNNNDDNNDMTLTVVCVIGPHGE